MDYHHVVEAAGAIALGLIFYSYTWRWFDAQESPRRARWRPLVNGVVFALLAILMTKSRIEVGDGRFIDPRLIPLALVTLVESSLAGAPAGGDAARLRALSLRARAAAHGINSPLTAVLGGRGLAARKLTPDSEEAKWIDRAREGGERIRDIVARMNRITQVEEAPQIGALPPILDIKKSSE